MQNNWEGLSQETVQNCIKFYQKNGFIIDNEAKLPKIIKEKCLLSLTYSYENK